MVINNGYYIKYGKYYIIHIYIILNKLNIMMDYKNNNGNILDLLIKNLNIWLENIMENYKIIGLCYIIMYIKGNIIYDIVYIFKYQYIYININIEIVWDLYCYQLIDIIWIY